MEDAPILNEGLIARYNRPCPRYTSYPTAVQFHTGFGGEQYAENARFSNDDPIPAPLSLYLHLPFCSNVCYYCACHRVITKNRAHAKPYLEILKKEIAMQARLFDPDRVVEQMHWGGGTPTFFSDEQLQILMREINNHFHLQDNDKADYSIEIDPREAGRETIALLRDIGFNRISLGIQDFNPDVQKAVNRVQSLEQVLDIVTAVRQLNYKSMNMDLIYGLPLQSVDSFDETLNKVIGLGPDRISVFNYAHMPEHFKMQRRIMDEDLPSPEEKLVILQHIIDILTNAGYIYIGMDHFCKPDDELAGARDNGTLCRNFQGYTTHGNCDLIGMGVTAISQINDCYSQNACSIDEYYKLIQEDQYPAFRGIKLDLDDRIRRDIIMQLMCYFNLSITQIEDKYRLSFEDYFYNELHLLKGMEKDGLLVSKYNQITVQPAGRLLIRNICKVFDKYLRHENDASRFSRAI